MVLYSSSVFSYRALRVTTLRFEPEMKGREVLMREENKYRRKLLQYGQGGARVRSNTPDASQQRLKFLLLQGIVVLCLGLSGILCVSYEYYRHKNGTPAQSWEEIFSSDADQLATWLEKIRSKPRR